MSEQGEVMESIFNNKIVPYEETDDTYASKVTPIYNKYTSIEETRANLKAKDDENVKKFSESIYNLFKSTFESILGINDYIQGANAVWLSKLLGKEMSALDKYYAEKYYKGNEMIEAAFDDPSVIWEGVLQQASDDLDQKGVSYFAGTIIGDYLQFKIGEGVKLVGIKGITSSISEIGQTLSKVRNVADDFLERINGSIIKLKDGYAFQPAIAGVENTDGLFAIIDKSEISNISKMESIASKSGRLISVEEIAPDIADKVKSARVRGTIVDLMDDSNKVLRRVVVPEGYRSTQQLLYKAYTGEIDVTKWGYTSPQKMEEAINNVNQYLNRTDLRRSPSLINSKNAGETVDFGDGISVEYDPLGFPIFKGEQLKADVSILDDPLVIEKGGVSDMISKQHMKAATSQLKIQMQKEADVAGKTLRDYLEENANFSSEQIDAIIDERAEIPDCIWHHNPETGRMQLVDKTTHEKARHNGGDSLWGGNS